MKNLLSHLPKILLILGATILGLLVVGRGLYKLMNSETYQIAGEIIAHVQTQEKVVALTFDDGPNEHVDAILGVLAEEEVPATFYVIGQSIETHPEALAKIEAAGHELGNHSYSHQRMVLKPRQFIADEVEKTNQLLRDAGYQGQITFRPPFGKKLLSLPLYLQAHDIKTITWDIEPTKALGSDASSSEIVEYVQSQVQPGSIILLHPWYGEQNNARDSIREVVRSLKNQGYRLVTVDELLKLETK